MKNTTFDILKWFSLIGLPAILTFAGVVMKTLNYEYTDIIITIGTAFNTMLGTMLGISNINYYNKEENKK